MSFVAIALAICAYGSQSIFSKSLRTNGYLSADLGVLFDWQKFLISIGTEPTSHTKGLH
jgi:hypothetical protein